MSNEDRDLADPDDNQRVTVPGHLLSPRGGEHYVLRVVGDSMIEEAIRDSDYVIVRRGKTVENGEMAVVLVGDEVTIKRVYVDGETTRLVPANLEKNPIYVPTRDVRIQGVVVGLMRKF